MASPIVFLVVVIKVAYSQRKRGISPITRSPPPDPSLEPSNVPDTSAVPRTTNLLTSRSETASGPEIETSPLLPRTEKSKASVPFYYYNYYPAPPAAPVSSAPSYLSVVNSSTGATSSDPFPPAAQLKPAYPEGPRQSVNSPVYPPGVSVSVSAARPTYDEALNT